MSRKLAVAAVVAVLGAALQASAVLYTPVYLQPPSPVLQAANPTDAEVAAALGVSIADLGGMLYKYTPGTGVEDLNASLFETVVAPAEPPAGALAATISYTGGLPVPKLSYILVKDGRAGWTIWQASAWNGSDDILVDNRDLLNQNNVLQGISHISIYGKIPSTKVPDGATTAMLLGLVMVGVGSCKRFIRG